MAYDVFISYSSKDKAVADATCALLERRNIRCWIAPRDVEPGRQYGEAIIDAIHHSRVMVLIFSSHANASVHISREVERAVSNGVTIIPLRIEEITPAKSLDFFIGSVHWLDAMTPPLEKHLINLAATIERLLPGIPPAPPVPSRPYAPIPQTQRPQKQGLPSAWIYGGAIALLAIAIASGWLFLRASPSKQAVDKPAVIQPVPPAEATSGQAPKAEPVEIAPPASPAAVRPEAGNARLSAEVPYSPPASVAPAVSATVSRGVSGEAASFLNKGIQDRDQGNDLDLAIGDFNQAIRLQSNFPQAYANRGDAYLFKGDFNRAAQDYDEALRLGGGFAQGFHRRGVIRFLLGQFGPAQEDLKRAIESDQPNADRVYDPIWLYLVQADNGQNARLDLNKYAGRLNPAGWPGPVTKLFLGTVTPESVLRAANDRDAATNARQQCQAFFFVGEYFLFGGNRANAVQFFQKATGTREMHQFAYIAARAELSRLQPPR
jgi:lipoprotein NlpI